MAKVNKKSKEKNEGIVRSQKEEKLFQNLTKVIEQFLSGKTSPSLTEEELINRLRIPQEHSLLFRQALDLLVKQQKVEVNNGFFSAKKLPPPNLFQGIARMHPRGFGFVQLLNNAVYTQDIFIPKHFTKNAVDGDEVEVLVNETISEKGPEGRITAILSRSRTHMGGIIKQIDGQGQLVAHVPLLGSQQRVIVEPSEEVPLRVGDRIVMEVVDWGSKETESKCRLAHYIGHISDPSCDIAAAIEEYELRGDFPSQCIEEAESFGNRVKQQDLVGREDLRNITTFTIDPDTAKDFDDALSLHKDKKGHYHLGVHIADVSHYVKIGTELDLEAQRRCNSTYFPNQVIPMLPSALSDNLCSLRADVNRLTISVLMEFDGEGSLLQYKIVKSVIKSAKRFSYKQAKQVLDGEKKSPYSPELHLMVELCRHLKRKRYERGSIEFALPELVVKVDEKGMPYDTDYISYDITHQMVEEFMLKANELVAFDLSNKGKNLTYRVHDEPAEDNIRDFSQLAAAFGFKIADKPSPKELQKLFEEAGETPYNNYLAAAYIRRMRLAAYSAENIGHYGLSLTHYCHFTSPIRRYVDLVVHRILFGESDDFEYLQKVANQCSEQERISSKAENSVLILKKLRLLETMAAKESYREFEAIVTKVKPFGIYFEIMDLLLEGFLHISELDNDYFHYEESLMRLVGSNTGTIYGAGDSLRVMLKDVNLINLEARWYLSSYENKSSTSIKNRKAQTKKKINEKQPRKFYGPKKRTKRSRKQ